VAGEVIVKFKENVRQSRQARIERQEGLVKLEDLPLTGAGLYKVEGQSVQQAIRDLNRLRHDVAYAEPNRKVYPSQAYEAEPSFGQLWGLHNTGQQINNVNGTSDVDINAKEAFAVTPGNPNLVIAVIDDGVDFSHPDLASRAWKNPGESGNGKETNGIDDDGNTYIDDVNGWDFLNNDNSVHDSTSQGHGTHVAGTIAASLDGQGVVGVAPNVKIMALKFMGSSGGSGTDIVKALNYAKSKGVKISNNSYGYQGSPSPSLKKTIEASGQLFVAAAGNGGADGIGDDNDKDPNNTHYPASFDSFNVFSVTAINNQGKLAIFSNYGRKTVDISAPGVSILSTFPGGLFKSWNGTSMAAPHATGAAALVASKKPGVLNDPPKILKYHLMNTGKPVPATVGKTVTQDVINAHAAVTQQICRGEGSANNC
jgi:subtilisin family serine protease